MDWQHMNGNEAVNWTQRSSPTSTQVGPYGVAIEHIVDVIKMTGSDLWICIPTFASDDYVTEMATYLYNNLRTDVRIMVEYSNEVWN